MALTTLLLAGMAASGAAGVVGAIGAIQSGRNSREIEKANATIAAQRALSEAEQHRIDTQRKLGSTRAAYGASGVGIAGTPMEVLGDDILTASRENELILWGGRSESIGHSMRGKAAQTAGIGQGISTLGNAAGTVLTGAYSYKKAIG